MSENSATRNTQNGKNGHEYEKYMNLYLKLFNQGPFRTSVKCERTTLYVMLNRCICC